MAPELRQRKPAPGASKKAVATEPAERKPVTKTKRKARDDASPITQKKQKSITKTTTTVKSSRDSAKSSKPVTNSVIVEKSETLMLEAESESDEEDDGGAQLLAAEIDSEEDDDEIASESAVVFKPGQDIGKIPKLSKELKKISRDRNASSEPGVVYIGRIPHGFYEHEMRQYFSQFGPITKLRLSRNKKTGASKHFAFIEFADENTAEIVAKTMDNYLLFGHILKCKVLTKGQVRDDLFKGANKRFKKIPWNQMAGLKLQKPQTKSTWTKRVTQEQDKRAKRAAQLQEMDYEFEPPQMKDVPEPLAVVDVHVNTEVMVEASAVEDGAADEGKVLKRSIVIERSELVEPAAGVATEAGEEKEAVEKPASKSKTRKSKRGKT